MVEIKEQDEAENLVFHYNREERIQKAPKMVRDYYTGEYKMPPKGLFKMLVYTKSSRIMLFVLVACLVLTLFIGLMSPNADEGLYGDVPMKASAFSFQDTVYAQLTLKAPKKDNKKYEGQHIPVDVTFNFYDVDETLTESVKKSDFYEGNELSFGTTSSDYDILRVEMLVAIQNEQSVLKATVKRD